MSTKSRDNLTAFLWEPQPKAAQLVGKLVDEQCRAFPPAKNLADRLHQETGTRLVDWLDHLMCPESDELREQLKAAGFHCGYRGQVNTWEHPDGMFPRIRLREGAPHGMALRVESVSDFVQAQGLADAVTIEGSPGAPLRRARVASGAGHELWVFERHGDADFEPIKISPEQAQAAARHLEVFRQRKRDFDQIEEGFAHAAELVHAASAELGVDWTSALFFRAERDYWQSRNRAGQIQKARQDRLGLGWGNHDHHTYRSSRAAFAPLIALFEQLGLECRERFYAGREAGWGAQVMEQANSGIVVFADVDLAPGEVTDDFAHEPLAPQQQLGTVGLWCALHGEALLQAGMHHLEAQFDFAAAREQLRQAGIESMAPFTDFPFLKQAFTQGEIWPIASERLERLLAAGSIDALQAEKFRSHGALGSHLEILERNDGYKGFNQTGISEIIRATDPRRR